MNTTETEMWRMAEWTLIIHFFFKSWEKSPLSVRDYSFSAQRLLVWGYKPYVIICYSSHQVAFSSGAGLVVRVRELQPCVVLEMLLGSVSTWFALFIFALGVASPPTKGALCLVPLSLMALTDIQQVHPRSLMLWIEGLACGKRTLKLIIINKHKHLLHMFWKGTQEANIFKCY